VLNVDPKSDQSWKSLQQHVCTDEVHAKDRLNPTIETPGAYVNPLKLFSLALFVIICLINIHLCCYIGIVWVW